MTSSRLARAKIGALDGAWIGGCGRWACMQTKQAAGWNNGQLHSPAARPPRSEAAAPCTRASRRCWSPWRPPSRCLCPGGTLCARHTASRSVSNSELKRPRACSRGTSWHSLPPGSLARWQAACPPSFCLIRRVRPAAGRPAASCCACATCCLSPVSPVHTPVYTVSHTTHRRRVGEVIF